MKTELSEFTTVEVVIGLIGVVSWGISLLLVLIKGAFPILTESWNVFWIVSPFWLGGSCLALYILTKAAIEGVRELKERIQEE